MASYVDGKVQRPAEKQHVEDAEQARDRSLFDHFRGKVRARGRQEHLVVLHVGRVFVMVAVRDAPGVVGHQQGGVQHEPDAVIDGLARRERLVTALVRNYPDAGHHAALAPPVQRPERVGCPPCN